MNFYISMYPCKYYPDQDTEHFTSHVHSQRDTLPPEKECHDSFIIMMYLCL